MTEEKSLLPIGTQDFDDDVAAGLAELGHEAEHLRVGEGIVLGDGGDVLVALLVEGVGAEAGHPLRAVGREAEEVRRRIAQRGVLRGRGAVDEGHVRLGLGVVLDREALVAGERADDDLHAVLLDELADGADGAVGRGVGRADHPLDLLAAGHAVVLVERQLGAALAVLAEDRERSLEGREQADLEVSSCGQRRRQDAAGRKPATVASSSASCDVHSILPLAADRVPPLSLRPTRRSRRRSLAAKERRAFSHRPSSPSGENEDDRQKQDADQRVEALGADDVDGEGLQQHDEDRAEERRRSDGEVPPTMAMTRMSISRSTPIVPGEMRPLNQTRSTPAERGDDAGEQHRRRRGARRR